MILTSEERAEWADMQTDAWARSTSVAVVAADLHAMLLDARQAGRHWPAIILADAMDAGLQKMAKAHRKEKTTTIKGPISTTLGVIGGSGKYEQLSLDACTPEQIRAKLDERQSRLRSESRNAAALRKLLAVCDKHPKARTLGAALRSEGVTIADVLAA